ncbi:MAG: hypothetical protein H6Q16_763 [Bacteroidetes bacterium]|nr:hypothetical protein [Bacteroidota bacterium]
MKKVLFVLGIAAAFSFAACNSTKDCACDILDGDNNPVMKASEAIPAGSLDVLEYDGDCADITWSEYTGIWKTAILMEGNHLKCVEK